MRYKIVTIAMFALCSQVMAAKIMPYTPEEVNKIRQTRVEQCKLDSQNANSFFNSLQKIPAIKQDLPNIVENEDMCVQIYLSMISRWSEKYRNPQVSDELWNSCYESSGEKFSHQIVGWVECIIRGH